MTHNLMLMRAEEFEGFFPRVQTFANQLKTERCYQFI